jgi:hypothetical protein
MSARRPRFTHTFYSLRIKTDNLGLDATANPELVGY